MLAYAFILFAVALRFMPHPMAFTPVGAALLFFGARGPRRQLWVPLALLAASDVVLTTMVYRYPFIWIPLVTWACMPQCCGSAPPSSRTPVQSGFSAPPWPALCH